MTHLYVPEALNVIGVSIPGAPLVIVGHNEHIAWGVTTAGFDVTDIYRETVVDCPTGGALNCVTFNGAPVPITTIMEDIGVGLGGQVFSTVTVPVEIVTPHGPIIPTVAGGAVVPRTAASEVLTYRWTGFEPSNEIGAFLGLMRASNMGDARLALDNFRVGAQNFVVATTDGDVFYSAESRIPVRPAAALDFDYLTNPGGNAPFFIQDGTGALEWAGDMDERYVPHAVNPATGYVATANNDQVGATLDNDPLRGDVDATMFYYGFDFDNGFRVGRIQELIEAEIAGDGVSFEDMQAIQGDDLSAMGRRLTPVLLGSMAALEAHLDGSAPRADLAAWAAALDPLHLDRMREAVTRLAAWDYRAPDGVEVDTTAGDVDSSVATSIFNAWLNHANADTFADEDAVVGYHWGGMKRFLHVVEDPAGLLEDLNPDTGDAIAFDDLTTPALESRDLVFLRALDDALEELETTCCGALDAAGFGTADMTMWRWGLLHTLRLESMVPSLAAVNILDNPRRDDPLYGEAGSVAFGFPRHGDRFGIDAANYGEGGFDFTYGAGPVMRMVVEVQDGVMRTENVLPGGEIYDADSPHFGDLMELWRRNETHPVAYWEPEVVAAYESRIVLHPGN